MAVNNRLITLYRAGLLLAFFALPLTGLADPVEIQAKSLELDHAKSIVIFQQEVRLTQGDFELRCDKLIGHYAKSGSGVNVAEVQRAEAYGHVTMRHGATTGSADEAQLDNAEGTLTLIGHAVIEQGGRRIAGNTIVHNLHSQDTAVTSGGDSRVRMNIESGDGNDALIPPPSEQPSP